MLVRMAEAVVSAPSSPQGAARVSSRIDRFVTCHGTGARGLPWFGVLARWDYRLGLSSNYRLVTFARVIRPVCRDTADDLIGRDLVQKFRQHESIPDVATGDLDSPRFQCFLVTSNVYPAPDAPFGPTHCPAVETRLR